MKTYTNISGAVPAVALPHPAAAPAMYGNAAVQQHFADAYAPLAQKTAVDLGRANTQAAADYTFKANAAQRQAALAGLNALSQQRQNAQQRDLAMQSREMAMQDMAQGWMRQMANSGALGGLL